MALTVQYALKRSEVSTWYWRAWRGGLWVFHAIQFAWVFCIVVLLFWTQGPARPENIGLAALAGLAAIAWMPLVPMIRFKSGLRTLTLDEQGVMMAIGSKSAERAWTQIRSIEEEGGATVIVGKNRNAFIIPVRAFETDIARREFLDYAKRAFHAATSSAT